MENTQVRKLHDRGKGNEKRKDFGVSDGNGDKLGGTERNDCADVSEGCFWRWRRQ